MKWVGLAVVLAVMTVAMVQMVVLLPLGRHARWPKPRETRRALYVFALVPASVSFFGATIGSWDTFLTPLAGSALLVFQARMMALDEKLDRPRD